MTCIVGIVDRGKVYIGADSLGSNGFTKEVRREHKVFENGEFLIGGTSSFRMLNLLKWKFNPPSLKDGDDLHKFMCTDFVDAVRCLFVDNGYSIGTEDWNSGVFLVGIRGRLFKVESDYQVAEYEYIACGSGEYHALGCMYNDKRKDKKAVLERALECAESFVTSVQRPFIIKSR